MTGYNFGPLMGMLTTCLVGGLFLTATAWLAVELRDAVNGRPHSKTTICPHLERWK